MGMAKTPAERQRDWRRRQAGNQSGVNRLTGELAAWKAEAKRWGQEQRAEIEWLTDALEAAREQAAGRSVPPCRSCGGELVCPQCARGGSWEDDFG